MSNSLSSFLVRSSSQAAVPFEGETSCSPLSAGAFLTGLTTSPHVSTTFLTPTSQTSDSTFLTSQAGSSKTFLSLSESSETAETFLSNAEGDVSTAEEVLLSRNVGEYEEVAQGPMLYLVPATGLHVLVHHLPHSTQETTGPQLPGDDSSQEQFVVVGALQSEEEQVIMERSLNEHPPGNNSHISVENMLTSHIVAAENTSSAELTTNQLFDSQLESSLGLNTEVVASNSSNASHKDNGNGNTLLNLHGTVGTVEDPKESPLLMDCSGTPMLTLQVPDENSEVNTGEIRRDLLDIESAPHINLEEIIEKFTGSSNHHEVIDNASSSTASDHIETTILSTSEGSADLTNITAFKEESLLKKRTSLEPHIHIVSEPPIQSSCLVKPLTSFTSRSNQRSNIPGKFQNDHDELSFDKNKCSKFDANDPMAIDEESLYDIVMTYRCKICSEVFFEKSGLLEHYQDVHKPGGVIKIRVTTSNNTISSLHCAGSKLPSKKACFDTPVNNIILKEASNNRREAPKELNILSCGFCSENFVGHQQYQDHINKEYPREAERKSKKGSYSHRYSQGVQTTYPLQPGMLIGHRKSRTYNQEEIEENKSDNTENRKRRVRAPKNLQDQYWLHKQKPKPVFSKEVERTFKCPLRTCKYKFSSEDNLNQHQQCHGQPGSGEERVFTCHRCFLKYDKWSMCQLHLWKAHGIDIDLFTCGICQTYKTCTQQRLVIHQKTHSDTRDHICKVCGKGFRQLAQLLNHQVLHITNAKNLPSWAQKGYCNECKRWFWDKKSLKIHISAVHLKLKPHACPHCSYRCSRKFDLKVHQRQHTGEQPHKCELCGWQGRDHNALRRHKLIHLHLKPLKCPHDFCLYESCHSAYFRRHIAKKHPKAEDIYKCQVCSMETPILQDYITHSTNHMKQLVKDAFKKRSDSSDIKKDIESSDAEKVKLESKEKDNFQMEKHKQAEDSSTVQDINSESFVFDSVSNSGNNSHTQVISIKLENVEEPNTTKSDSVTCVGGKKNLPIFKQLVETNVDKTASSLDKSSDGIRVLGAAANAAEEKTNINVGGGETLMTLPQVMVSQDGQQYLIGISSDEMNSNHSSFTILYNQWKMSNKYIGKSQ